jgi:hypothetical protein
MYIIAISAASTFPENNKFILASKLKYWW